MPQHAMPPTRGAGLGFRRELIEPLKAGVPDTISFFELAPENWAGSAAASPITVSSLVNGVTYSCSVVATISSPRRVCLAQPSNCSAIS